MTDTSIRADLQALERRLTVLATRTTTPLVAVGEIVGVRNRLAFERERIESVRHLLEKATTERRARRLDGIRDALEIL